MSDRQLCFLPPISRCSPKHSACRRAPRNGSRSRIGVAASISVTRWERGPLASVIGWAGGRVRSGVVRVGMEDCDCGKAEGLSGKPTGGQRRPTSNPRTAARAALCHREQPIAADDEHRLVLDFGSMRAWCWCSLMEKRWGSLIANSM